MKSKIDLPAFKLPEGKGSTLFLCNGLISNGHFLVSSDWINSLEGNPKLSELFEKIREAQLRDVTAKLADGIYPKAPVTLASVLDAVKLKFYKPVDLGKLKPITEWNGPEERNGNTEMDWIKSVHAYAFKVNSSPIEIEVNSLYCALLTVDPETKVLAKTYNKPIAILKNGVAVAVIMPMLGITAVNYEKRRQNAKSK